MRAKDFMTEVISDWDMHGDVLLEAAERGLFESDATHQRIVTVIQSIKQEEPVIGNSYVYASFFPTPWLIHLATFQRAHKLIDTTESDYVFDVDGIRKKLTQAHPVFIIRLLKSPDVIESELTWLSIEFSPEISFTTKFLD